MTAEAVTPPDGLERADIGDGELKDSLVMALGSHAIPVWGFGQRGAFEELVMEGPSLDHWVRTGNLWAEQERNLWEWEQMVAALVPTAPAAVVDAAIGDLAERVPAAITTWVDLMFVAVYLDGIGEHLMRTLESSCYAPLRRHATVMVMYKRGQFADGLNAFAEVAGLDQLPRTEVDARRSSWSGLARELVDAISAAESSARWTELGVASPFDGNDALAKIDARLDEQLEED